MGSNYMKKTILSFLMISMFIVINAFAAEQPVRSSAQKARKEKARCEAITDTEKKEECLKKLEEKAEKRKEAYNKKKQ